MNTTPALVDQQISLAAKRKDCAPLAGKSTLNRVELSRPEPTRYHKVSHEPAAIEMLFVDLFVEAHRRAPAQIVLDLDATGRPAARAPGGSVLSRLLCAATAREVKV